MITRRKLLSLTALAGMGACLPFSLSACDADDTQKPTNQEEERTLLTFLFNTVINIKASCSQEVLDLVEERLIYFENTFSKTIEESDIYRINHAGGAPTNVQPETADILTKALTYCELSGGLFDISIGGVVDLWDFIEGVIPDPNALAEALTHVDYHKINVEGNIVTISDPETHLDLGAIAKGYITDDIVTLMKEQSCESALINLGGNTYAYGTKPDGSDWRVGIQDPNEATGTVFGVLTAHDKSVVTSGINERSFERDGVLYHHLLDPRTGMPAQNGIASTTIVSDLSVDGDAFSTITFIMGLEDGTRAVEEYGGLDAFFIDDQGGETTVGTLEIEPV